MPVVYVDILFFINFMANYLLLWTTKKVCQIKTSFWRICLGSGIGALYAVFMFFPSLNLFYGFTSKLLFSIVLISVTFTAKTIKQFFRLILSFYLINFSFAGALFAAMYFTDVGVKLGAIVSNGVFYFNLPLATLLISSGIAYIIIMLGFKIAEKRGFMIKSRMGISIGLDGKSVDIYALVDTGNALSEPISQMPVVVAEMDCLKNILPDWLCSEFLNKSNDDVEILSRIICSEQSEIKLRLIPFSSLGKENGMLVGFKPDFIKIKDEDKTFTDVIVGIYNKQLSKNNDYNALLHPQLTR